MSEPRHFRNRITVRRSENGIAYVALARPEKYNGLDLDMLYGLVDAAKSLRRDRSLRAVILQGEGKAFCAGLDFASVLGKPLGLLRAFIKWGGRRTNIFQQACWAWRELPVPVIAVTHGHCFGGGLQIALAADFRFTTPDCEFSVMESKWGLIPDMTGSVSLRELVPMDVAKALTMTGRIISGEEALHLNLVTGVSDDPLADAEALAQELLQRSPDALAATKRLFHEAWAAPEDIAFDLESKYQFRLLRGKNQRRAMQAARNKEAPAFLPRQFD